ncbi:MAG: M56 family metallopeptidase [Saprospiraceae bacterium]
MEYLIHTSVLLAACFAYYWFVLRRETHFTLNRWVLLGCLVGSLALPLITVPATWSLRASTDELAVTNPSSVEDLETATTPVAIPRVESSQSLEVRPSVSASLEELGAISPPVDWFKIIRWVYLIGVLIFGFNFLIQFGQLMIRMLRNPGHEIDGFRLIEMQEDEAPYSFWNRIFLNPDRYDPDTFHQIVQHEQIHVRQRHSLDLLLAEAVVILQWFNPFAWLYRKAIEHNLEYLTDDEMLRSGADPESYQLNLVKVAVPNFPNGLVASYNQSFLEKRITMMKAKKSSLQSSWKYLAIVPLLLISVLQFNTVAQSVAPVAALSPSPTSAPAAVFTPEPVDEPLEQSPQEEEAISVSNLEPVSAHISTPSLNIDLNLADRPVNTVNSWTAIIDGQDICFQFMSRSNSSGNGYSSHMSHCYLVSDFGSLPRTNMGEFRLKRTSGTMKFKGIFDGNDGIGNYTFVPDAAFESRLEKEGYGSFKEKEMLLLFLADVDEDYLKYISAQGYPANKESLIELSIFFEDLNEIKSRTAGFKRLGYAQPSLDELVELQIHGVTEAYAEEMKASGFRGLTLPQLKEAKIHGLDANLLEVLSKSGYDELTFDSAKEMAHHGITAGYISEMNSLGYSNLSARDIVEAKIHGVDASKIKDFRQAGLTDLTLKEAKDFSIHGVTSEFVNQLKSFGYGDLRKKELLDAKIHGVNAEFVGGLRSIGYKDLTMDEIVKARIHGVTPEWADSFREVGFKDIPFRTLIELRIHRVSPAFIKENMKEGRTLKEYVKMKIMGL